MPLIYFRYTFVIYIHININTLGPATVIQADLNEQSVLKCIPKRKDLPMPNKNNYCPNDEI